MVYAKLIKKRKGVGKKRTSKAQRRAAEPIGKARTTPKPKSRYLQSPIHPDVERLESRLPKMPYVDIKNLFHNALVGRCFCRAYISAVGMKATSCVILSMRSNSLS
jgi:hypothetical protein